MSLPESQILATLSTEIIYPVPSVSFFNEPSSFFEGFESEFVEDFKRQIDGDVIRDEFLPMPEIVTKTNNIIANKSAEIFTECIKEEGFRVLDEESAKELLDAIRDEKLELEKTNNLLVNEVRVTNKDIDTIVNSTFDTVFIKQLKGEEISYDISEETINRLASEEPGFGTFDDLETFLASAIEEIGKNG